MRIAAPRTPFTSTHSASLLASAALALLACSGPVGGESLNVVWVVLDASGARHFRAWGGRENSSPELDLIGRESVLSERAIAQWPATLSSTSSFLTGRYPNPLVPAHKLSEPGIATRLRKAGWRTAAFSENPNVSAAQGFEREFGEFHSIAPLEGESGGHDVARRDSEQTVRSGLNWIDREAGHYFLYLHLLPPHAPYTPPAPFFGKFRNPAYRGVFDGRMAPLVAVLRGQRAATRNDLLNLRLAYLENIAYVDRQLGLLIRGLRERKLFERGLLIVSSDHGEAFGEHGAILHGSNLYDEQLHVPLLIRFPKRYGVPVGRREETVELTSLVPTILDAAGLPPLEGGGQSLLRVARGEEPARRTARAWLTLRSQIRAMLIDGRFKLIVNSTQGTRELYDLSTDPGEVENLARERPALVARLEAALADPVRTLRSEALDIGAELREQLEAIGYVEVR